MHNFNLRMERNLLVFLQRIGKITQSPACIQWNKHIAVTKQKKDLLWGIQQKWSILHNFIKLINDLYLL